MAGKYSSRGSRGDASERGNELEQGLEEADCGKGFDEILEDKLLVENLNTQLSTENEKLKTSNVELMKDKLLVENLNTQLSSELNYWKQQFVSLNEECMNESEDEEKVDMKIGSSDTTDKKVGGAKRDYFNPDNYDSSDEFSLVSKKRKRARVKRVCSENSDSE